MVVLRGGGGFGGGAQEGSGLDHGGEEEVWEATEAFSSPLHADGQSGCKCTIILSPLSLYGSHRRWLAQVVFWWLRGGGE